MTSDHARSRAVRIHRDVQRCTVAVVGGGPAGLTAALELSRTGVDVLLLEESEELGGQYYKRRLGAVRRAHGDFRPAGSELISVVRNSGVRVSTGHVVWGVDDDGRTLLTAAVDRPETAAVQAEAIVVATGAYERAVPFPGWQLPGVVTPGYALHLATCDVEPVGRRVLLAGTGPFLLPVACALLDVGVDVVGIAEANRPYRPSARALGSLRHPARLRELAGYLGKLAARRVPIWQGTHVAAATGHEQAELTAVELVSGGAPNSRRRTIMADTLAVGYGFRPSTELIRLLGADCRYDERTGDVVPVLDDSGRTSVRGLYAAGEVAGIAGVHAAMVRGRLVAHAVQADLGRHGGPAERRLLRRARRLRRFADLQADLFPVPWRLAADVPDHTQVCRCEGVSAGEIRVAAGTGWNDRNGAKGATRAGMGPCQGRQCGFAVAAIGAAAGLHPGDPFPARMPLKPVPVSTVIGALGEADPR